MLSVKNKEQSMEPCGTPHFFYGLRWGTSLIELSKLIVRRKVAFSPPQGRITDTIVFQFGE